MENFLNGVETIHEIPKQIYLHGKEIVQTTTSLVRWLI